MVPVKISDQILNFKNRFNEISNERKELLELLAAHISNLLKCKKDVKLNFICTHNSRRSHMGQIWAQTAAEYFSVANVYCFSGGTEVTAFNPRAVKAIKNAGFLVEQTNESENPISSGVYLYKLKVNGKTEAVRKCILLK